MYFDKLCKEAQWMVSSAVESVYHLLGQGPYDIHLSINGMEIDLNDFASALEQNFDYQVNKKAQELALNVQVSKFVLMSEVRNRVYEAEDSLRMALSALENAEQALSSKFEEDDNDE